MTGGGKSEQLGFEIGEPERAARQKDLSCLDLAEATAMARLETRKVWRRAAKSV